jgi:RNA polymerase sigma factor for flagellar operon FliA
LLTWHDKSDDGAPARRFERSELERVLIDGLNRMPKLERNVLSFYFVEELTLREIGEILDLQPSRISQIKTQGLLRLRSYMDHYWPSERGI